MSIVPRHRLVLTFLALLLLCGATLAAQTYPRIVSQTPDPNRNDCSLPVSNHDITIHGVSGTFPWKVVVLEWNPSQQQWQPVSGLQQEVISDGDYNVGNNLESVWRHYNMLPGKYKIVLYDMNDVETDHAEFTTYRSFVASDVQVLANNAICGNNGSIQLSILPGNPPYKIRFNGGAPATTSNPNTTFSNLAPGTYTINVVDDRGCSVDKTVTITGPSPLSIGVSTSFGPCEGNGASLTISGGTAPYTVSWSDGGSGTSRTHLAQGSHTVTVTDANGCTRQATVPATQPAPPIMTLTGRVTRLVPCNGLPYGEIQVTATNGTAPITYTWTKDGMPVIGNQATNTLGPGIYVITATDANGCTATTDVVLDDPAHDLPLSMSLSWEIYRIASQVGRCWGAVTVTVDGGVEPYTVFWPDGPPEGQSTGIRHIYDMPVTVRVTVVDARGCTRTDSVTMNNCDMGPGEGPIGGQEDFKHMVVTPNPTSGQFTLDYELNNAASIGLQVMNSMGGVVYSNNIGSVAAGTHSQNIDISSQTNGTYYVSVIVNGTLPYTLQIQKQ